MDETNPHFTQTVVMPKRLATGTRVSHYVIQSFLGAGGMGQVYAAKDEELERTVAIKLLLDSGLHDADRVRRFIQEGRAASALNHPNIVTVHGHGECEHGRFIVMEMVQGRSLREQIRQGLTMEEVLDLAAQMAKAVAAAHAAGIVHRDLKPANVMVREDHYVEVSGLWPRPYDGRFGGGRGHPHQGHYGHPEVHVAGARPRPRQDRRAICFVRSGVVRDGHWAAPFWGVRGLQRSRRWRVRRVRRPAC